MTNSESTVTNDLAYTLHLIDKLPGALLEHVARLGDVRQRLEELDGRTCTGHAHWRDKDKSGKTAKLYILHGTDQACPIHGEPPRGRRTRFYVGNKPDKIADALATIERETERQDLQQDLNRLHRTISYATVQIRAIYRVLGCTPPEPGQDLLPHWPKAPPMVTR